MADTDSPHPGGPGSGTDVLEREDTSLHQSTDKGWNVVLHNDPVNLVQYVVVQLQRILEVSEEQATELAMKAHNEGRAVVFHGDKDAAKAKVEAIGSVGLWASAEAAS